MLSVAGWCMYVTGLKQSTAGRGWLVCMYVGQTEQGWLLQLVTGGVLGARRRGQSNLSASNRAMSLPSIETLSVLYHELFVSERGMPALSPADAETGVSLGADHDGFVDRLAVVVSESATPSLRLDRAVWYQTALIVNPVVVVLSARLAAARARFPKGGSAVDIAWLPAMTAAARECLAASAVLGGYAKTAPGTALTDGLYRPLSVQERRAIEQTGWASSHPGGSDAVDEQRVSRTLVAVEPPIQGTPSERVLASLPPGWDDARPVYSLAAAEVVGLLDRASDGGAGEAAFYRSPWPWLLERVVHQLAAVLSLYWLVKMEARTGVVSEPGAAMLYTALEDSMEDWLFLLDGLQTSLA
jgi:hypothetical protein